MPSKQMRTFALGPYVPHYTAGLRELALVQRYTRACEGCLVFHELPPGKHLRNRIRLGVLEALGLEVDAWPVCGNPECIHPEHLSKPYDVDIKRAEAVAEPYRCVYKKQVYTLRRIARRHADCVRTLKKR